MTPTILRAKAQEPGVVLNLSPVTPLDNQVYHPLRDKAWEDVKR